MSDRYRSAQLSRRRFLAGSALVAGGAVAAPLLGGCNASSSSSSDGSVTLTVMYPSNELTKEQIADFEAKNSGIKISLVEFDQTRLNAMLASGKPPDFVRGAAVGSANTNARGLATSLDPYLAKSTALKKDDLLPVNDSFRWDGKKAGRGPYYGIVKDWSPDATLWYNAALFDAAKVAPLSATEPVSYDELLEIAKKLTVKEGGKTKVYGLGVEWAWNLWAPISMMIMQQGVRALQRRSHQDRPDHAGRQARHRLVRRAGQVPRRAVLPRPAARRRRPVDVPRQADGDHAGRLLVRRKLRQGVRRDQEEPRGWRRLP